MKPRVCRVASAVQETFDGAGKFSHVNIGGNEVVVVVWASVVVFALRAEAEEVGNTDEHLGSGASRGGVGAGWELVYVGGKQDVRALVVRAARRLSMKGSKGLGLLLEAGSEQRGKVIEAGILRTALVARHCWGQGGR